MTRAGVTPARIAGAIALTTLVLLAGCDRNADAPDLIVFAAASTADALTDATERFEAVSGARVRCHFAASSTLARQIELGARADVYVSAHPRWTDRLQEAGLVDAASRRDLLANRLVVVVPRDRSRPSGLAPLDGRATRPAFLAGRVAMADPDHVPAGLYARQAMETLGWWEELRAGIIATPDVRGALRLVEMGEADAAFVYASDAAPSEHASIAATVPASTHDPIRYPVVTGRPANDTARAFVSFLFEPSSSARFEQFGFVVATP